MSESATAATNDINISIPISKNNTITRIINSIENNVSAVGIRHFYDGGGEL